MFRELMRLWRDDSGQDLAEYAVLAGVILAGAVGLVMAFRDRLSVLWQRAIDALGG